MKLIIKILLFLSGFNSMAYSQNTTIKDTLTWNNNQIITELPKVNRIHIDTYEEGIFKTISCYLDSAVITIFIGSLMNLPLINLKKYTITSEFNLDNDIHIIRGSLEYEKDGIKRHRYFREENYNFRGITIMYENVDESKLSFYDHILNNMKIVSEKKD